MEIEQIEQIKQDIKRAQKFELAGESFCAFGSILYIVDSVTHKQHSVSILYLIGSSLFLVGSILMIIQSIITVKD